MNTKRLIDVTENDLLDNPVWEHWAENEIEFAKQTDKREISEFCPDTYIVLTKFKLANGTELKGFCSPQDTSGLDYTQPIIFTENGQFRFWRDGDWTPTEQEKELIKIELECREVFPVEFEAMVLCDNEFYKGKIADFNKEDK
jgi:hypothetical protein